MQEDEEKWPKFFPLEDSPDVGSERRKMNVMIAVQREKYGISNVVQIDRYGSLEKVLRVTAYVMRFVKNLKEKKAKRELDIGKLKVEETEEAERVWIKDAQKTLKGRADFEKLSRQLEFSFASQRKSLYRSYHL